MEIDISVFEREIAAEYMRLFADEIEEENKAVTVQVMSIASTAAAIAVKMYEQRKSRGDANNDD
ncbi:hypothetical protein FACS1894184_05490 [Clostridia bacterium]|nr:hypothetical protein FACS1894184_05490 [Clostridia bacterium]